MPPSHAATQATGSKKPYYEPSTDPQYRSYELKIAPSNMNHQAYIERQGYYGPFVPNKKTMMAADLEGKVPLAGLVDCQIGKPEPPFRWMIKCKEEGLLKPFSLKELYEKRLTGDKT